MLTANKARPQSGVTLGVVRRCNTINRSSTFTPSARAVTAVPTVGRTKLGDCSCSLFQLFTALRTHVLRQDSISGHD